MAQHRIMSILLFVCLSLCTGVAQSQLQPLGGPCLTSTQCQSECCIRSSPRDPGKCASCPMAFGSCYGPKIGNGCFRSDECNSGCCIISAISFLPKCVPKAVGVNCLGRNDGDACYSSDQCNSGCCFRRGFTDRTAVCEPKRGQECFGPNNGDPCNLSTECNSGCCHTTNSLNFVLRNRCAPRGTENEPCNPVMVFGKYIDCPCVNGLTCTRDQTGRLTCKKPGTANN